MADKVQDDELVMGLVDLALACPPSARERYLHDACDGDARLFSVCWGYVEAEERMNGFLLEPLIPLEDPVRVFEADEVLDGRFRIVQQVDEGGMGVVYEAFDQKLGRRIAIKFAKTGFHKRLPPEVVNASQIAHPNVCKTFEVHTALVDGREMDFITMEFLEGETLAARLKKGRIPDAEARQIATQLCAGLAEAHRNQVIHGDLKSNNVILAKSADGSTRAVITDFGLARKPESAEQEGGYSSFGGGAPDYMAPELWKGEKASLASDVYALGVILHELASGRRPFGDAAAMEGRLHRRSMSLRHAWDGILARCLDPMPGRRFQSAQEVLNELGQSKTHRWLLMAAALVLVSATGWIAYVRTSAPVETIRLAVLPFASDQESSVLADGLLLDTSNQLNLVKAGPRRLTTIPVTDALQNKIDQPTKARTALGATHALHGMLERHHGRLVVTAYLTDLTTQARIKEWRGEYTVEQEREIPVALAGMVTGALRLPTLAIAAAVSPAAYSDYITGVSLARRNSGVDEALVYLGRAVTIDPVSPLTHAKLAEVQWMKHRASKQQIWLNAAVASLRDAESRNPDVSAVRFVSGVIHQTFGQYEQAEADFQRAIELEPYSGDAWRRLAKNYELASRPIQAASAYRKAIEVQPAYFKNYQELGAFYFAQGNYEAAIQQYQEMVTLAPDLPEAHYALSTPYLNMGQYEKAEAELVTALSYGDTAKALEGMGLVRTYQGHDDQAIPYFKEALTLGVPASLYYINLGTAYRRAHMAQQAENTYREGLEVSNAEMARNPQDSYERACFAYLSARQRQPVTAERLIAEALRFSGGTTNVRWMAVLTYDVLGFQEQALSLLEEGPPSLLDRAKRFSDLAELQSNPRFQKLLVAKRVQ